MVFCKCLFFSESFLLLRCIFFTQATPTLLNKNSLFRRSLTPAHILTHTHKHTHTHAHTQARTFLLCLIIRKCLFGRLERVWIIFAKFKTMLAHSPAAMTILYMLSLSLSHMCTHTPLIYKHSLWYPRTVLDTHTQLSFFFSFLSLSLSLSFTDIH